MLNVLCVRTGQKYSPEYVHKLRSMVECHLKQEHRFICLTEHPAAVKGVDTIAAPIQIADSWCKIGLFCPSLAKVKKGDKMLFLDLDVIVTGSLDNLIAGKLKDRKAFDGTTRPSRDLWIAKDWRDPFNSSVMYWVHGEQSRIYGKFTSQDIERLRGDQNLIAEIVPDAKTFKEGDILSYKFDKVDKKPKSGKVVLFHGKPKMTDLPDVQWVQEEWN